MIAFDVHAASTTASVLVTGHATSGVHRVRSEDRCCTGRLVPQSAVDFARELK